MSSQQPIWRFQFSLRTLLLLMLFVGTFFAGRYSLIYEMDELRANTERARQEAQDALRQFESTNLTRIRINGVPQRYEGIEAGMKASEYEHLRRSPFSIQGDQE